MTLALALTLALLLTVGVLWVAAPYGWGSRVSPEQRLLKLCRGNRERMERLIDYELERQPGIARETAIARAVLSIRRDNR